MTKDIRSASWRDATAGRSKDKNKALRNNIMEGVARKEIFQQGGHEKKRRETMQDPEATGLRNGVKAGPPAREKKGGSASGELAAWNSTGPFGLGAVSVERCRALLGGVRLVSSVRTSIVSSFSGGLCTGGDCPRLSQATAAYAYDSAVYAYDLERHYVPAMKIQQSMYRRP